MSAFDHILSHTTNTIENNTSSITWTPDASWYQGRGVYGGLLFACMSKHLGTISSFPIRNLHVDLCAPILAKETLLVFRKIRKGINTDFFHIEVTQQHQVIAHGTAICGGTRYTGIDRTLRPFPAPPLPSTPPLASHPLMPTFTQYFSYWPTMGNLPFSASTELTTGGWISIKDHEQLNSTSISALIDAWWPCLALALDKPRSMGTISCSIDFMHSGMDTVYTHPYFLQNTTQEIVDGYAIEHNTLWTHDGTLLAHCQQNVVVIN